MLFKLILRLSICRLSCLRCEVNVCVVMLLVNRLIFMLLLLVFEGLVMLFRLMVRLVVILNCGVMMGVFECVFSLLSLMV